MKAPINTWEAFVTAVKRAPAAVKVKVYSGAIDPNTPFVFARARDGNEWEFIGSIRDNPVVAPKVWIALDEDGFTITAF